MLSKKKSFGKTAEADFIFPNYNKADPLVSYLFAPRSGENLRFCSVQKIFPS